MCEVRLSVKDIKKRIKGMLEEKRADKCVSIYKVPLVLTEENKDAYIPNWVSIGPYHHEDVHLSSDMFTQKMRAVHRMMLRLSPDNPNMSTFEEIVKKVQKYEIKIKERYETDIKYDGEYLSCMMAIDGCFVLEILRCLSDNTSNNDPFFNRHKIEYASYSLLTDILLLENQIPMFVLISLLKLEMKTNTEAKKKLSQMLIDDREVGRLFYPFIFNKEEWSQQVRDQITAREPAHLLDLAIRLARWPDQGENLEDAPAIDRKGKCRSFNFPCMGQRKLKEKDGKPSLSIPTATELSLAGIHFEPCEGGLTRVSFSDEKSTLHLPKINVTASSRIFLRNLMAYEVCQSPEKRIVSNFAVLMDELINTDTDVALLRRKGIIHSYTLGSDTDVASFFNDLRKGTVQAGSSSIDAFKGEREKLLKCYRLKYRVMFAEFMRAHFSKPWRTASVAVAVVLLILTVLQTIYAIIGA